MTLLTILVFFVAISFIYYGINCLYSKTMKSEFERYDLKKFRILTGILQLLGGTGLIVGYFFSEVLVLTAAFGLFLLMTAGFAVRLRLKDSAQQSAPSLIYAILSLYIVYESFLLLNIN